jgi:hypothetical protein
MKKLLTEWRKFIKENEMPQRTNDGIPAQVYYGLPMDQLPSVRDNGIVNLPQLAATLMTQRSLATLFLS